MTEGGVLLIWVAFASILPLGLIALALATVATARGPRSDGARPAPSFAAVAAILGSKLGDGVAAMLGSKIGGGAASMLGSKLGGGAASMLGSKIGDGVGSMLGSKIGDGGR